MRTHLEPAASPEKLLRLAAAEHRQRKRHARTFAILAVSVAAGLGGLLFVLKEVARTSQPTQVTVDPAKLPPIRPGPR